MKTQEPITRTVRAAAGDVIVVEGLRVGEPGRMGEILEVLGEPGHEHYGVRWDDDAESIFYPTSGTAKIKHDEPAAS